MGCGRAHSSGSVFLVQYLVVSICDPALWVSVELYLRINDTCYDRFVLPSHSIGESDPLVEKRP